MQVFLPYSDFKKSVRSLDYKRLGKQRVECKQILNALDGTSKGWTNHPATKMFRGYETALMLYANLAIEEWKARGYNNTMPFYQINASTQEQVLLPGFIGEDKFHLSHRSNLLRKFPEYYGQLWPDVPNNLPYVWPLP